MRDGVAVARLDRAEVALVKVRRERDETLVLLRRLVDFCDRGPKNPLTDTALQDAIAALKAAGVET